MSGENELLNNYINEANELMEHYDYLNDDDKKKIRDTLRNNPKALLLYQSVKHADKRLDLDELNSILEMVNEDKQQYRKTYLTNELDDFLTKIIRNCVLSNPQKKEEIIED